MDIHPNRGSDLMLEARELRKSFGAMRAVDGVSLTLQPGRILGLLGPNGAGKTTTVSMLCGLCRPDSGQVRIEGRTPAGDDDPVKGRIGIVPQEIALYDGLSARDNLRLFGGLYGLRGRRLDEAVAKALDLVELARRARDKVGTFSGGMQRRLNLVAGLLHDPAIVLLDEPTVGVDPQSRHALFDEIEALRDRGKAILYTTHYMEEAERLCDHIVILDHGKVIAEGRLAELAERFPKGNRLDVELETAGEEEWLADLRRLPGVRNAGLDGTKLGVVVDDLTAGAARVLGFLGERALRVTHVASERAGLAEIFLALTGRSLRDQ
jgi:ABC-2 type transport system ATP-binding protein